MPVINTTQLNHSTENEEPTGTGSKWVCQMMAAEGIFGVSGNLLVCFVILRVRFLRNMTNYLLVNLAVADMLTSLLMFVYNLVASPTCALIIYIPASFGERQLFCRLIASDSLVSTFYHASAYSLCLVTLERYIALVHPLQYARKLTAGRMASLVALVWLMSVVFSLPFLFRNEPADDSNVACANIKYHHWAFRIFLGVIPFLFAFLLPIVSMCWANYKMQVTLKRQATALFLQHARPAAYDLVIARQHLVKMLAIVSGALIILWTPSYVGSFFCLLPTNNASSYFCDSNIRAVFDFFFYLNSVVNPVIYEFKCKKFRQGLKIALCSCRSRRRGDNRVGIEMTSQ